jgi:hypothetical protein
MKESTSHSQALPFVAQLFDSRKTVRKAGISIPAQQESSTNNQPFGAIFNRGDQSWLTVVKTEI